MTHVSRPEMDERHRFVKICEEFVDVSRETLDNLDAYAKLLEKWQKRINLVSRNTLPELWTRHFLDSAQVFRALPPGTKTLVDMGSGAGFPGLVLAILGVPDVHLIESDTRKVAFLREAARVTGAQVTLHNDRIENVPPFPADVVTARALASIRQLLDYAHPFLAEKGGFCIFPKGRRYKEELDEVGKNLPRDIEILTSLSDPESVLIKIAFLPD